MSNDFDKFVDAFIEHAMKTTGMTREELLKGWSVDGAPAPVIEVGDTLTVGEGDECEHKVLAHPTEDFWCVSGYDKLFNWHDLNSHFELIRKGPKVHSMEGKNGSFVAIYNKRGVQVDYLEFDNDICLNVTATSEEAS